MGTLKCIVFKGIYKQNDLIYVDAKITLDFFFCLKWLLFYTLNCINMINSTNTSIKK